MNGDGKLDVITANSGSNSASVLTGDGAGTFTAVAGSPFAMGIGPNHVIAVDLDNDQKLDLVTANTGLAVGIGVTIRKGDGLGGFGNSTATALSQAPTNIVSADFNLDGNADIAVSQSAAQFSYLTGTGAIGAATFNTPITVTVPTQAGTILAAPFHTSSDDLYDVVTTSGNTNNLAISLNLCL